MQQIFKPICHIANFFRQWSQHLLSWTTALRETQGQPRRIDTMLQKSHDIGGISTDFLYCYYKMVLTQRNNLCTYAIKWTISTSVERTVWTLIPSQSHSRSQWTPRTEVHQSPVQNPWKISKIPHYDLHHQDIMTCLSQQQPKTYPSWSDLFGINLPSSAFNKSTAFPSISSPPAQIHPKPDAKPYAHHSPIPVPYNWKAKVKASLDRNVARGIIKPVPIVTPFKWCSTVAIILNKNGSPLQTVDLQHLNSQCSHETHHCQSPFQLACQVPPYTKKTVLDAIG